MASESEDDDDGNGNSDLLLTLLNEEKEEQSQDLNDSYTNLHHQHQQQEENDQLHYLHSIESTLIIRQLPSQGLSFQLWPAASSLVSLLDRSPPNFSLLPSPPTLLRILELGSGTGLVGIAAASILGAHVTLTDLPHVIPNLRFNALANAAAVAARGGSVAVCQLSWGEEEEDDDDGEVVSSFDVVMASDVVYYDHLFDPLLRTLRGLVKGEVGFVMAHLRRWNKRDSVFFRKARKLFDVELLHTDAPLPESRIGVAVYRFTAKKSAL